jgi:hypothetical protein
MSDYELPSGAEGLIAALAVGLVIGLERGWHERELPEGGRVAGICSLISAPGLCWVRCSDSPCC